MSGENASIEVSVEGDTYTISREDVGDAFEETEEPYDSHSARVYFNGESKGVKDVFRNIEEIPNDVDKNTNWMERRFDKLGFETGRVGEDEKEDISVQAWHVGTTSGNDDWWPVFTDSNSITVGWESFCFDVSDYETKDEIERHSEYDKEDSPGNPARQLKKLAHEMEEGDLVFAKQGQGDAEILGIGVVTGEYDYNEKKYIDSELESYGISDDWDNYHHREVNWLVDLTETDEGRFNAKDDIGVCQWTLNEIDYKKVKEHMLENRQGLQDVFQKIEQDGVDEIKINEQLLESEKPQAHLYRQAAAHLVAGKNVVFYGPPGTGKTRAADLLTDALCASDSLVTANAEWSNYQVVGGYRPAGESWEPDAGFLTAAAERCTETLRSDSGRPSWLIIDELNRANLDEAFGDVFTLLDLDYRTTEPLSYADEDVYMPLSFRILATMNTYDQAQLFSLGYAFRRRFAFVRVPSLLEDTERSTRTGTPIPSAAPELNDSAQELVELIEGAAVESMSRGSEGEGVTERDVAAIFPEFADEETLREALETVVSDSDLQTNGLTPTETLVYFCMEVTDRDVIDIGQALLIDVMKYLIAHQLLFPEETSRLTLDDAVVAYIVPQFEHFMSELRRAETIDQDSDAEELFDQIVQLAEDLSLPETAAVLEEAKETKQLLT